MAFTGKQARNGADVGGGYQNSAQPGPSSEADIASGARQAKSAAIGWENQARDEFFNTAQGNTPVGRQIALDGALFEWDSGLAVDEQSGEM